MQIKISVGPKAGTPANQQMKFTMNEYDALKLADITQNDSYSAIEFRDGIRHGDNFIRGHLIILDFDDGMTLSQAFETFKPFYGMIATTKSHQQVTKGGNPNGKTIAKRDRFRVILFLKNPIEDKDEFVTVNTNFINRYGSDPACKDIARYYYPNPKQEHWFLMDAKGYIDIDPFKTKIETRKVSKRKEEGIVKSIGNNTVGDNEYITISEETEIRSADGDISTAQFWYEEMELDEKIDIHCPFPGHDDNNPSAFITKTEKESLFVYCSSCGRKGFYNRNTQKSDKRALSKQSPTVENITVEIKQFSNILIQRLKTIGEFKVEEIIDQFLSTGIPITSFASSLYFYIDGYWQKHANPEIERKVFIKEALRKIIAKRPSSVQIKQIHTELLTEYLDLEETGEILINFNNRVLKVIDGEYESHPHDKKYGMKYKLPFDFDPERKCPSIDTFMMETIGDQATIDFLYEFIGSIFIGNDSIKIEKAVFLHGMGSNGKSVLLDLLRALLGQDSISSVALKDMNDEKRRVSMVGKLLNITAEGSQKSFDSEDFKSIISREPLSVRHLYQDAVETGLFPRLIFATNNLPFTDGDYSHGIFRRIAIIPFENIIPDEKQDKNLLSKLIPELPGMMNRVLEGMVRLIEKKNLCVPEKIIQAGKKYEIQVNPVKYFFDEKKFIHGSENTSIYPSDILFSEFKSFCNEVGIHSLSKRSFVPQVNTIFGKQVHSNTIYGWRIVKNKN